VERSCGIGPHKQSIRFSYVYWLIQCCRIHSYDSGRRKCQHLVLVAVPDGVRQSLAAKRNSTLARLAED
jgi:hypothetical protein